MEHLLPGSICEETSQGLAVDRNQLSARCVLDRLRPLEQPDRKLLRIKPPEHAAEVVLTELESVTSCMSTESRITERAFF